MNNKKTLFIGEYNPSIILTYIGVMFAMFGIQFSIINMSYKSELYSMDFTIPAVICMIMSGICDLFDGAIARKIKRTDQAKLFGVQLDSLADIVSFGIQPAIFLWSITSKDNSISNIAVVISILYIICSIQRLAWFNVVTEENKGVYFGLPVTFSALIIPSLYVILKILNLKYLTTIYYIIYTILAILFILNSKIKKPGKIMYIVMSILAILEISILLFT